MPNVPKTGLKEIDEKYNKVKEQTNFLNVLSLKEEELFYKFEKFGQDIFHDLDSLLSISYTKNDEEVGDPSFAMLPFLLQSFLVIHNPSLE